MVMKLLDSTSKRENWSVRLTRLKVGDEMRRIESFIISNFQDETVRRLRIMRSLRDYLKGLVFSLTGGPRNYFPYGAKYFSSSAPKNSKSISSPQDEWGEAFSYYRQPNEQCQKKHLIWADTPIPGNYGDWLSPYILKSYIESPISHLSPMNRPNFPHFIGLGSIISSSNPYAHIIGSGIARRGEEIDVRAKFHAVRGPYSAERIRQLGGPNIEVFGDPGFLLPLVYQPCKNVRKQIEVLVVRHINHRHYALPITEGIAERSILAAKPEKIESFIDDICKAKLVVTSAMHCFITCVAYGVPCVLFKPENDEIPVPGDGVKYRDTLAGVGMPEISPTKLAIDQHFLARVRDIEPYEASFDKTSIQSLKAVYETTSKLF